MSCTATQLRKELFSVLERVSHGEVMEVDYKGSVIRLSAAETTSKLARAKRRNALMVDPDSIVHSDVELMKEIDQDLEEDWSRL